MSRSESLRDISGAPPAHLLGGLTPRLKNLLSRGAQGLVAFAKWKSPRTFLLASLLVVLYFWLLGNQGLGLVESAIPHFIATLGVLLKIFTNRDRLQITAEARRLLDFFLMWKVLAPTGILFSSSARSGPPL